MTKPHHPLRDPRSVRSTSDRPEPGAVEFWVSAGADDRKLSTTVPSNGHSGASAPGHAATRKEQAATTGPGANPVMGSVGAHRLLTSSAVVSMGISTLLRLWDNLSAAESKHLLEHMATHASAVADGLKLLTLGLDTEVLSAPVSSNGSARTVG